MMNREPWNPFIYWSEKLELYNPYLSLIYDEETNMYFIYYGKGFLKREKLIQKIHPEEMNFNPLHP